MTDANPRASGRALLLIDFQRDFIDDDGRMPVARNQVGPVLAASRTAIAQAQAGGDVIIKIGNEFRRHDVVGNLLRRGAAIAGRPGTRWDPRFDAEGAIYLAKWKSDAFCNPALYDLLRRDLVEEVRLAGLFARACITATAKGALARGLRTCVLADAVACRDDRSRDSALRRLKELGVELA